VLGISLDYAFCLHSKERVPYHIVIKVALDDKPESRGRSDSLNSNGGRSYEDGDSSSSSVENLVTMSLVKSPDAIKDHLLDGSDDKA